MSGPHLACSLTTSGQCYEDEAVTAHYVRTLVWSVREQVRRRTGWDEVIWSPTRSGSGLHQYKLPENTVCDLWEFESRLDEAERCMVGGSGALAESGEQGDGVKHAALLREEALQLYRGEFCEGSTNGFVAQAARALEERYVHAALQQGDFWRSLSSTFGAVPGPMPYLVGQDRVECASGIEPVQTNSGAEDEYARSSALNLPAARTVWREALRNYARVLKVDRYHEEATIFAMECNARLGNSRELLRVFNTYRETLRRDLQQEPAPEVMRAYRRHLTAPGH